MSTIVNASWIEEGPCDKCKKTIIHNLISSSTDGPGFVLDSCQCAQTPIYVTDIAGETKTITVSTVKV